MKKLLFLVLFLAGFATTCFAEYWYQDIQGNWHSDRGDYCYHDIQGNWHCN